MQRLIYYQEGASLEGYDVLERFDFGDQKAALVEVDDDAQINQLSTEVGPVDAVEEPFEAELQTAETEISTADASRVELDDIRNLHNIPDDVDPRWGDGDGVTVAVMDSGVDTDHEVFDGMSIDTHNFAGGDGGDKIGHGTAVAGLIAQLAPEAEIISLRIFGGEGTTGSSPVLRAYEWLTRNTDEYDIVNMSWGTNRRSSQLDAIHDRLVGKGVRDVVAAGNSGREGGSPATSPEAYSVGACDGDGNLTRFTSYNDQWGNPDVVAVGKDIRLAQADGTTMGVDMDGPWVKSSGTSFSAPISSALTANAYSADELETNQGSPADIAALFTSTARDIEGTPRDGAGLVDFRQAIENQERAAYRQLNQRVQEYLERSFGADNVETDKYYADPRGFVDFEVSAPFATFVVEIENASGSKFESLGQLLAYAEGKRRESPDVESVVPVLIVPRDQYGDWPFPNGLGDIVVSPFPNPTWPGPDAGAQDTGTDTETTPNASDSAQSDDGATEVREAPDDDAPESESTD